LNKSEASVSTSVVLIHTTSEDSSDSNSNCNSASDASVNHTLGKLLEYILVILSSQVNYYTLNFNPKEVFILIYLYYLLAEKDRLFD